MAWAVYWDNGAHACGTFPERYATEAEAQEAGNAWAAECNARDGIDPESDEAYSAEALEVDDGEPCSVCGAEPGTVKDEAGALACADCADGIAEQARQPREWRP